MAIKTDYYKNLPCIFIIETNVLSCNYYLLQSANNVWCDKKYIHVLLAMTAAECEKLSFLQRDVPKSDTQFFNDITCIVNFLETNVSNACYVLGRRKMQE